LLPFCPGNTVHSGSPIIIKHRKKEGLMFLSEVLIHSSVSPVNKIDDFVHILPWNF
jgi:hypothetical protein